MKFIKGNQTYPIDSAQAATKIRIDAAGNPERPWALEKDDHFVLVNHALAFHPYPSWGVILERRFACAGRTGGIHTFDINDIRPSEPLTGELTFPPDAWDHMRKADWLDDDGFFKFDKYQADQGLLEEKLANEAKN